MKRGYDENGNYHTDTATSGEITKEYDKGTPDSQPNPNAPGTWGGVFDPEEIANPRLNPYSPADGKPVHERFAEIVIAQTTDLGWQETLEFHEQMVTNPGLLLGVLEAADQFSFIEAGKKHGEAAYNEPVPSVTIEDQTIYSANGVTDLGGNQAALIGGHLPVDTVDPESGLGAPIWDQFIM